ncbi:hypothetical protein SCLCIDRAFT_1146702 [Scleroderma citrinum Foug A]|uniref:Uncharacterized protein n=1 Tax=Scleroderma citrinum Foug A TaxID=1036808 RepID=A0A0C3D6P9_9AGAM|nr:hypothetical protein SCLCIDRAFT_1146702 [Scleroderma citrinum Foug A]
MTMQFYDVAVNEQEVKFNHQVAVLLACAFGDGTSAFSGGFDNGVHELDLETEKMMYLGNDSNAVSAMSFSREQSMSISLHWLEDPDLTVLLSNAKANTAISTLILPEHIYHLDLINILIIGMASPISYMRYLENGSACADEGQ